MSAAKTPVKVLRTALNRIRKGWTKGHWSQKNNDGGMSVCLEGALFGYCDSPLTQAQRDATSVVHQILKERFPERSITPEGRVVIPSFNDNPETTKDEVMEVLKLAIIRIETSDSLEEALADDVEEMFSD